jgi:hypothetical protein
MITHNHYRLCLPLFKIVFINAWYFSDCRIPVVRQFFTWMVSSLWRKNTGIFNCSLHLQLFRNYCAEHLSFLSHISILCASYWPGICGSQHKSSIKPTSACMFWYVKALPFQIIYTPFTLQGYFHDLNYFDFLILIEIFGRLIGAR